MKSLLLALAIFAPVSAFAGELHCTSARNGMEMSIPMNGDLLAGNVKLYKLTRTFLDVPPTRVVDFSSGNGTVSFSTLDENGTDTVLKFEATKNEFGRFVGYILYNHLQIGFVCIAQ